MLRVLILAIVIVSLSCDRREGPTTPAVPESGSYSTTTPARDDDEGSGRNLHADEVLATVIFSHIKAKFRECDGQDGHYAETQNVFTGTSTGDPRLSGRFEFAVIQDLVNFDQDHGPQLARVEIRDAATGRKKAEGVSSGWGPVPFVQGTIVGVVHDEGGGAEETSGSGKLIANFRLTFSGNSATMAIGGTTTDTRLPAGIWKGACGGVKWTKLEVDLDQPGLAAVQATTSGRTSRIGR